MPDIYIGARRFGCLSMASRLGGAAARVVKGVARRTPARAALTLTPEAVQRVKLLMQKEPEMKALKVGFISLCQYRRHFSETHSNIMLTHRTFTYICLLNHVERNGDNGLERNDKRYDEVELELWIYV